MFPDSTPVTGSANGKVVTVNIENTTGMRTTEGHTALATLKPGYRPAHTYNQFLGYNKDSGAWLMMSVRPDGTVNVYHMWLSGEFVWGKCYASATFVAA